MRIFGKMLRIFCWLLIWDWWLLCWWCCSCVVVWLVVMCVLRLMFGWYCVMF